MTDRDLWDTAAGDRPPFQILHQAAQSTIRKPLNLTNEPEHAKDGTERFFMHVNQVERSRLPFPSMREWSLGQGHRTDPEVTAFVLSNEHVMDRSIREWTMNAIMECMMNNATPSFSICTISCLTRALFQRDFHLKVTQIGWNRIRWRCY